MASASLASGIFENGLASASLVSDVLDCINLPRSAAILEDLLTPDRDLVLDAFDDVFTSFNGFGAVDGGSEDKQTDLSCRDDSETMVNMQAGYRICFEGCFSDFVELEVSHLGISGVFDSSDWLPIDHVISDLAEEDAVGTDILFGAMGGDRFGDEIRRDRAIDEDFFWFLFCHYRIKSTDTSHADANANEGLCHGILILDFIERKMTVYSRIKPNYLCNSKFIRSTYNPVYNKPFLRFHISGKT